MRVLLAVSKNCDPQATSDYVAARFDGMAVEIDVLSIVLRPSSPVDRLFIAGREEAEQSAATELVTSVAKRLGEHHGFRRVRTHVQRGVIADVILAASERWHSASILIGTPREQDMLTTLGIDSVAHTVSTHARCPVELLRVSSIDPDEGNRVLAVMDVDRLDDFPFDQLQLQSLSWKNGSLLRILGVLPPVIDISRTWASAASVLRKLNADVERRSWATARLDTVCRALTESFGRRVETDYRLMEGNTRGVALESAERLAASLLILDGAVTHGALWRLFSSSSPAAITMAAPCSVLLLRSGVPSHRLAGALSRL